MKRSVLIIVTAIASLTVPLASEAAPEKRGPNAVAADCGHEDQMLCDMESKLRAIHEQMTRLHDQMNGCAGRGKPCTVDGMLNDVSSMRKVMGEIMRDRKRLRRGGETQPGDSDPPSTHRHKSL